MVVAMLSMGGRRRTRLTACVCTVVLAAGLVATVPGLASASALASQHGPDLTGLGRLAGSSLVTRTYALIRESDGNHPASGSQVDLLFAANDKAFVYASNAKEAEADNGTYSYSGGRLSLHVEASDVKISANFALDLSESQVTMPFQIFSEKPGTSLWQQEPLAIDQGMFAVYNAATNTAQNFTAAQAGDEAYAYAQAWLAAEDSGGTSAHAKLSTRMRPASSRVPCGNYCITNVVNLGDDIQINYRHAPSVLVDLYSAGISSPSTPLTLSSLASDPRVFLDPSVHPDSQFNPPVKTAVLISPVAEIEDPAALTDISLILKSRHYAVKELLSSDASILAIVTLLKHDPGFVLFSTHGNTAGQLQTGQALSVDGFFSAGQNSVAEKELATELSAEGLKSLTTYKFDGTPAYYVGEPNCSLKVTYTPSSLSCKWKVVITPTFWNWLETRDGVSFAHSLVFISVCETDTTSALRDQIRAEAYFAFTEDVASNFATAVERYLVESLYRPTHSPEEAFYNMLRIERTHQMIYKEDALFQGVLGASGSDASFDILDGWGWNGSTLVPYRGNGWQSTKVNGGQVWWMLYAARWSTNTKSGVANLNNCYAQYWSKGNPGGLASPYCNAANAGIPSDPTSLKIDVAYAIYLLNGTPPAGFSPNQLPPRWTMDD